MAGGACITCYSSISLSGELISAFKEGIIFFLEGKQPNKQTCEHLRMSPRGQCISFETSLQKMKACISHTRWTISWFRICLEKLFLSIYPNENRESWNPPRIHGLEVPNLENTSVFPLQGILQARILEWVAMPSSRGSSWPRDPIHIPCASPALAGRFVTAEPPGTPLRDCSCILMLCFFLFSFCVIPIYLH